LKKNYPQLGFNPICVCLAFWLVSVHKDVDVSFLLGFAFLMSFQLLYNEIFQWGFASVSGNFTKCQLITIWPDS